MTATDELKEYAEGCYGGSRTRLKKIAERIDEVVASEYVKLPKDKDGEVIHFGDVLNQFGTPMAVYAMSDPDPDQGDCMLELIDDGLDRTWVRARKMCHVNQPTVEDVLREFANEVQTCWDFVDTINEYADRIREVLRDE